MSFLTASGKILCLSFTYPYCSHLPPPVFVWKERMGKHCWVRDLAWSWKPELPAAQCSVTMESNMKDLILTDWEMGMQVKKLHEKWRWMIQNFLAMIRKTTWKTCQDSSTETKSLKEIVYKISCHINVINTIICLFLFFFCSKIYTLLQHLSFLSYLISLIILPFLI